LVARSIIPPPASVDAFGNACALADLIRRAGFARVEIERAGTGTVAIHIATKSDHPSS
jgi:hypothetical protein